MDINTNLNLLNAVQSNKNAQNNVPATPANQNNNQLLGGQTVPQDILDIRTTTSMADVNMRDINNAINQMNRQTEAFQQMIQRLLNLQGHTATIVNGETMIQIDEATRLQAQRDIADDGYFGVEQTSERILSFARAFAGDDPVRGELMRDAFIAGFEAAQRAWGGDLPEISQRTFDAVMAGFDQMMGINQPTED
ncbi:MAG: hypothetical protein FWD97_05335 [Defluviitaleaceae bacterium]|nr:hypothetical protein [Defluviitaleaceae bacterium]